MYDDDINAFYTEGGRALTALDPNPAQFVSMR